MTRHRRCAGPLEDSDF